MVGVYSCLYYPSRPTPQKRFGKNRGSCTRMILCESAGPCTDAGIDSVQTCAEAAAANDQCKLCFRIFYFNIPKFCGNFFKKYFYTGVRYNAFALQAGFNLKDERNHCDRSEVMTSVTKLRHRGKYNLRNRGSIH